MLSRQNVGSSYLFINLENNDVYQGIIPQFEWSTVGFSRAQVGFTVKSYAGLGLFTVNDIVSFDYQNEAPNREMCRERRRREGWNAIAYKIPASANDFIGRWL